MSSSESLREFISQRLTAAAAEIFSEFEKTIVQYEEEIDRQRRLLDITWRPEVKLHRTDLQQDLIFKEEDGGPDQQLCNQDRNSSLDQKEPEPPQIKEEPEEEQLVLKQEYDIVMVTPAADGINYNEPQPNMDQLLCQNSLVAEDQDQQGTDHEDSELSRDEDPNPENSHDRNRSDCNNVDMLESRNTDTGKQSLICVFCGKSCQNKSLMRRHLKIHLSDKRYPCTICDKSFTRNDSLLVHMRTHTGERPYSCQICGKSFTQQYHLTHHMRSHTGEKPFSCKICGKSFSQRSDLLVHMRIHTGEKPYSCTICHKTFTKRCTVIYHTRIHTGEKPHACEICGKSFTRRYHLTDHMKTHTGGQFQPDCP